MSILLTIFVLSFVVLVHEYGHYVVMRRNGVEVEEFSVGLGPVLLQHRLKSGTWVRLRLLLLGGYAKPKDPSVFETLPIWGQVKIAAAGPLANAISATVAVAISLYAHGATVPALPPYVAWAPMPLQPLVLAIGLGFGLTMLTPYLMAKLVFTGSFFSSVMGPVGIISAGSGMIGADHGQAMPSIFGMCQFFALLSVSIGGFNLLPLFPLDGGRIVGAFVGKIGPRAARAYEFVGLALFMILVVMAFASDGLKLLGK